MYSKKKINKILSVSVIIVMLAIMVVPIISVIADDSYIVLRSADDYAALVTKCKNDAWSQGKTVSLEADIDLSYDEFKPIPTFGGNFKGNGYTITGVSVKSKGSNLGLFRYIQSGAVVENLNVKGEVFPEGTKKRIGGIVGECSGILKNCSFEGDVKADANVGGICGYLTESGQILNCRFNGSVTGESYTGGIAGQNYGLIQGSENSGRINTTDTDETKTIQDTVTNIDLQLDLTELRSTEKIDTSTDTGGICGFSKGRISECINYGNVGYKSIGYNTGGICGRQSGSVQSCQNYGEINGRKDIGGIAGQAEPYILLQYSEDALVKLNDVLDKIQNIIDESTAFSGNELSDSLDRVDNSLTSVSDSAEALAKSTESYADKVADETNALSDRLHKAIDDSSEAIDSISDGGKLLSDSMRDISDTGDILIEVMDILKDAAEKAENSTEHLKNAATDFEKAMDRVSDACEVLEENAEGMEEGFKKLKSALANLKKALQEKKGIEQASSETADAAAQLRRCTAEAAEALTDTARALDSLQSSGYDIGSLKDFITKIDNMAKSFKNIAVALGEVTDAFLIIAEGFDVYSIGTAFRILAKGFDFMSKGFASLKNAIKELEKGMDALDGVTDKVNSAIDGFQNALDKMADGGDKITEGTDRISEITDEFSASGKFELPSASEMLDNDIDTLFDSFKDMQSEFSKLSDVLKDKKDNLSDDASDLNDQLKAAMDILRDTYDKQKEKDESDLVEDISDKDFTGDSRGKIENSYNKGNVYGDLCAGGIVGSMAIEYDFDPEDDIKSENTKSLEFTYKSKCVVRRCNNSGAVQVKKNYCGGVTGRMDLGSIISCEGYGNVTSDDGDYVGGIAGISETVVRNSAAKCEAKGKKYIGGIAGKASELSGNYAIVNVSQYDENAGTIAGSTDQDKTRGNYFINDNLGGIDDISYKGKAEETDVAKFVSFVKGNFGTDTEFKLRFVADDKEIATVPFKYKEAISEDKIPKVPEKSGYYGKWSYYDYSCAVFDAEITAEYYRDVELLPSDIMRGDKSIVLICGAFDDSSYVNASENNSYPNKLKNKKINDSYNVEIIGSYTEKYTVRYLPKSDKSVDLFIETDSGINKVSTKKFGSYLEFETDSSKFVIYETPKGVVIIAIISVSVGILLGFGIFLLIRKKRIGKK